MGCPCCGGLGEIPLPMDLCIYRGDTYSLVFPMVDDQGAPIDLTGRNYAAVIKPSLVSVTSTPFVVSVSLVDSTVTLTLDPATTADPVAVPRRGVWDLQEVIAATGEVTTLFRGRTTTDADVTP